MTTEELSINARPHAISIDPAHSAVIVVDMQNDFGAIGGMFERRGLDISGNQAAVKPTARVLEAARQAGLRIIYLKMAFQADLSDLGPEGTTNRERHLFFGVGDTIDAPDGTKGRILIRDTWNTDIVPELAPQPDDAVVYKHRFSGFFETELDALLRGFAISDLVFTGWTTSICVESTVRDAMFRDYRCLVLDDCTAEPIGVGLSRSNHEASVLVIETLLGCVSNSSEFIRGLARSAAGAETPAAQPV